MDAMSSATARSSFSWGMKLMPEPARAPVAAIYDFCRAADDAVDLDPKKAPEGLAVWKEEVDRLFQGAPRHRVMLALHPHVRSLKLKREHFDRILAGLEMDAVRKPFLTAEDLYAYCDGVAVAPGRLVLQALGCGEDPKAGDYCRELGYGLQLTNILRDLGEDVKRGRIYWPAEEFGAFEYKPEDLKLARANQVYFKLARFQWNRALKHLKAAGDLADGPLRRKLAGPEVMRETYLLLHAKLGKALDEPLDGKPPRLSKAEKAMVAFSTWLRVRFF